MTATRKKNPLKDMQTAYRHTFGGEMAKDVLADLRIFCYATKTHDGDPMLEGRRQVFYRIMTMMKVPVEDVYDINMPESYYD